MKRRTLILSTAVALGVAIPVALQHGGSHADAASYAPVYPAMSGAPAKDVPDLARAATSSYVAPDAAFFRVGSDSRYPAWTARAKNGDVCLVVKGDDGMGGTCNDPAATGRGGLVALGEVRADGTHVVTALVPEDVTRISTPSGPMSPVNSLVTFAIAPGRATVAITSTAGDRDVSFEEWARTPGR